MRGIDAECKKDVVKQLSKLIGSRVIDVRVGDSGFDLVFNDGHELEVYVIAVNDAKSMAKRCCWGVAVPKYVWYMARSIEEASRAAEILSKRLIDATIVGPLPDGRVYVGVNERMVEDFKKVCGEDDELKKLLSC